MAWALAFALALGGCLGREGGQEAQEMPAGPMPEPEPRFEGPCDNALVFQLVDYGETDPYLPPGFHPSDAQNFLPLGPVAFGQGAVLFLVLSCPADSPYQAATLDIFVEAPVVEGIEPARFNFYEVERYGHPGPLAPVLAAAGWKQFPAEVQVSPQDDQVDEVDAVGGNVSDEGGVVLDFVGAATTPMPLGPSLVRFWQEVPEGLAYVEFDADIDAVMGSGSCSARTGTGFAAFLTGPMPSPTGRPSCLSGDPILATFPGLYLNATARSLPGVHAG